MSRFFSARHSSLVAYTPGEQPKNRKYIKLNTNESPFPPSPGVIAAVSEEVGKLQLYSDPTASSLHEAIAKVLDVSPDCVLATNGSDEILNFAFMAFGDESHPFAFADITYGFYPVFADLNRIPYRILPLREDFSLDVQDYIETPAHVVIANPNAPTGMALSLSDIERIVAAKPDRIVIVDEAYVDFGGQSAVPLTKKYDNLLVTRTFSKSYSLAGGRLGFGVACPSLIADLNTIKYSTNPYNVNRMTMAAGVAAMAENEYYMENCRRIMRTRDRVSGELRALGFAVLPSCTNFVFAGHETISGATIYEKLREKGILVRHFTSARIREFNRITIGSDEEMDAFLCAIGEIIKEENT